MAQDPIGEQWSAGECRMEDSDLETVAQKEMSAVVGNCCCAR